MEFLPRSSSVESTTPKQTSLTASSSGDMQDLAADMWGPPSPSNVSKAPHSLAATGRVPSHSLLTGHQGVSLPNRKGRFADAETVDGDTERASICMPPPSTKPSSIYRPSTVRRPTGTLSAMEAKEARTSLDGVADCKSLEAISGLEGKDQDISPRSVPTPGAHSPSTLSESNLKPPTSTFNKPGDRLSFSSLVSLGPSMFPGAPGTASAPPSAASSTAASLKSFEQPTSTAASMHPSIGPGKTEAASPATTATDPVSVTANSQPVHQGLAVIQII